MTSHYQILVAFTIALLPPERLPTNQQIWRRTAPGDPPDLVSGEKDGTMGMIVPYSVFQFTVEH